MDYRKKKLELGTEIYSVEDNKNCFISHIVNSELENWNVAIVVLKLNDSFSVIET